MSRPAGMFCCRCARPIGADEEFRRVPVDGATGPGATLYQHAEECRRAPTRTYPLPPGPSERTRRRY